MFFGGALSHMAIRRATLTRAFATWGCLSGTPSRILRLVRVVALCSLPVLLLACEDSSEVRGPAVDAGPLDGVVADVEVDAVGDAAVVRDAGVGDGGRSVDRVERFTWVDIPDGRSEPVEVELPPDVLSLTLVVRGEGLFFYVVGRLEGPEGQVLVAEGPPDVEPTPQERFSGGPFPGPFASPNRSVSAAFSVAAMMAPNNPGVALTPGLWRYRLLARDGNGDPVSSRARVTALIKRGPSPQVEGTLDLHLHFTGARGWTAATAPRDPDLSRAIERTRAFYAGIGVTLGEITYDDISETYRTVDAGMQVGSTLERMFALGRYDTGVNLFFVDRINSIFGGDTVGGIAGGTPGPTLHGGTSRSGVAVATALDPDPAAIGHIMAHETGHYLGLFHTTEITGVSDQIPDTGEGREGADNLMFPTVTRGSAQLSDGQGWVLHRNPSVLPLGGER